MKRRIFFLIHIALAACFLQAQDSSWEWEAAKADSFFYSGEYDAAWLFYERAMTAGVDDAKVLFRAAESFSLQEITENPEFQDALYNLSNHLMQVQYPDDPAAALAEAKADPEVNVNRRYIRKTFGMIGAKAPRTRRDLNAGFVGRLRDYASNRMEDLAGLISVLFSEGPAEAVGWARGQLWNLLVAYVMIALIPGIILPAVMAVTVAREGRKSYVTAYLFLLFWGPLGIHRFYLGRFVSGIIWLLTAGLAGLGVFFDIFLTGAYIRFWNEDNRDGRPSAGARSTAGAGVSRKVKKPKAPKPSRQKKVKAPKKTRTPKAAKPPKPPKKKKEKESRGRNSAETAAVGATAAAGITAAGAEQAGTEDLTGDLDSLADLDSVADESFGMDDFGTGDLPAADALGVTAGDDDFGDLPDLDLDGDDFDIPDASDGGSDNDEFDLGSLE